MKKQIPLVSVLMTVFNGEAYLAASIESILAQTYPDWEFLIVDDASTDNSLAIAEAYAAKESRIRIIRNDANKGQTACLNQGLQQARGTWIARQDADDLSHSLRLEKQIERVLLEPSLVLLGTAGYIIDQGGDVIGLLDVPLTSTVIRGSFPILNPFLHTAVLFQTEVIRSLGGYREQYRIAQDYELWGRLLAQEYQVANLSERLVSYRHLESSLSKQGRLQAFEEAQKVSQQQEEHSFGRSLWKEEREAIALFREGSWAPSAFWKSLQQLLPPSFWGQGDARRLQAIYRLKNAGRHPSRLFFMAQEIIFALYADFFWTLLWMMERFFFARKRSHSLMRD